VPTPCRPQGTARPRSLDRSVAAPAERAWGPVSDPPGEQAPDARVHPPTALARTPGPPTARHRGPTPGNPGPHRRHPPDPQPHGTADPPRGTPDPQPPPRPPNRRTRRRDRPPRALHPRASAGRAAAGTR
jgi:hypothetical protein